MMELKIITKMYLKGTSIRFTYVFLLLLLLCSCRENRNVSEFVVDPPYETKVEYMKDTIRITYINLKGSTEEDISIWVKKNGKYYANGELMMSTEEHTDSFSTIFFYWIPCQRSKYDTQDR